MAMMWNLGFWVTLLVCAMAYKAAQGARNKNYYSDNYKDKGKGKGYRDDGYDDFVDYGRGYDGYGKDFVGYGRGYFGYGKGFDGYGKGYDKGYGYERYSRGYGKGFGYGDFDKGYGFGYDDKGYRYDDKGYRYDDKGYRYDDKGYKYDDKGYRYEDKGYGKGYEKEIKYADDKKYSGYGKDYRRRFVPYKPLYRLKNGYYVAFIAHAHNNQSVYDKYEWPGNDDAYKEYQCACLPVHQRSSDYKYNAYGSYKPCRRHYKSYIVQRWKWLPIDKVRVSVYSNWKEEAYFEFNGWGSNSFNFFSKERLIDSCYDDLKTCYFNYFSVKGHVQRRFFINHEYAGHCKGDDGWLAVVDGAKKYEDKCYWTDYDCYPVFLYSKQKSSQVWNKLDKYEVKKNDAFVISVTFKHPYNRLPYRSLPKCYY